MKKFTFCVVKQHFNLQESGDYTTYGISSNTDSQQLSLVSDVSCDLAFVNCFGREMHKIAAGSNAFTRCYFRFIKLIQHVSLQQKDTERCLFCYICVLLTPNLLQAARVLPLFQHLMKFHKDLFYAAKNCRYLLFKLHRGVVYA